MTEESIRKWFRELNEFLSNNELLDILDDPSRMFNGDEIAFCLCPKTGKVIGPKGWKNVYSIQFGNEKETITVLVVFSGNGCIAPPMIVFPYKRLPKEVAKNVPIDWTIGLSDSGWMRSDNFFEYISNDFNMWLTKNQIQRPVLLLIDGHRSHLNMHTSKFCEENKIILYALPPNTTHILQPADVSVFRPLKANWKKTIQEWQSKTENINNHLTKVTFAPLLAETLERTSLIAAIKNGFRCCGLYPFNPNAVDYLKCVQNALENLNTQTSPLPVEKKGFNDLEAAVRAIAPNLLDRGLDVEIIFEEIEKAKNKIPECTITSTSNEKDVQIPVEGTSNLDNAVVSMEKICERHNYNESINLENVVLDFNTLPTFTTDKILQISEPEENPQNTSYIEIVELITTDMDTENNEMMSKTAFDTEFYQCEDIVISCDDNIFTSQINISNDSDSSLNLNPTGTLKINIANQAIVDHEMNTKSMECHVSSVDNLSSVNSHPSDTFKKHIFYPESIKSAKSTRNHEVKPSAISSSA